MLRSSSVTISTCTFFTRQSLRGRLTSKLAKVKTVPTSSSVMVPLHVAILELITLIASLLCLSFSTRRLLNPFTSIPYNAQFANVAWRRPASLSTKNFHVCLALMATELFFDALLSAHSDC
jgi:hypothetical protein